MKTIDTKKWQILLQASTWAPSLVVLGMALIESEEAWARAGGGNSYSSGRSSSSSSSSSSSGGSSSGGGDVGDLINLVVLIIRYPHIGIPLLFFVGVYFFITNRFKSNKSVVRSSQATTGINRSAQLGQIKSQDPDFSEILFLDLARLIYTRAQEARGRASLGELGPFLDESVVRQLSTRSSGIKAVREVILGAARIETLQLAPARNTITVYFDTNYTEVDGNGKSRTYAVTERWRFGRAAQVRSPGPERMQSLSCAACGSPLETDNLGRCRSCGQSLSDGRIQWQAEDIHGFEARPLTLSLHPGAGVEVGTDMPLVQAPDLSVAQRSLKSRHPEFVWTGFRTRAEEVFVRIQEAWSSGKWEKARPFETDFLYQQHRFWIERYAQEGLRNGMTDLKVTDVVLSKISVDTWYESITVRIFARMKDWTEDKNGKVVGGSKTEDRIFSEYWTFIRTTGHPVKPRDNLDSCPSCGAPLDQVSQTGVCGYCEAKITGGDFDWVLAMIDQDEVYRG